MDFVKRTLFFLILAMTSALILFPLKAALQQNFITIQGEVKDQNDAVIAGAKVVLKRDSTILTAISDEQGKFVFRNPAVGSYNLQIEAEGFGIYEESLIVEARAKPLSLSVTLYPTIKEDVSVNEFSEVALDPERAAGTQVLTERELEVLPDDPDQLKEHLQQLAASSGSVPGQAVMTVDGFRSDGRLPPKSSIASIRVSPNNYSAEYETPAFRGGRIEVTTKPGADSFNGSVFFNFNDDALNARDAFAATRAPTQTRQYGFQIGAPIVRKKSGFFVDFEKRDIEEIALVNAFALDASFQPTAFVVNVPTPRKLLIGSARADWLLGANRVQVLRYDFNSNRLDNQGIGGFNLPERSFNVRQTEHNLRFTDALNISPKMSNELRIGLTLLKLKQEALSGERAISVAGAFTSGGANTQFLEADEKRLEIIDNIVFRAGNHNLRFGTQNTFRQVSDVRIENTNGTFYFGGAELNGANISALEQYRRTLLSQAGGIPTRFSIALGSPSVEVKQWRIAGFVQDDWQLRKNLILSLGFRYEAQTVPTDLASFAPRFGVAFSPDKKQKWILRARGGVFYDRISEVLSLEAQRIDGVRQQQIILDAPAFPNPFGGATANNSIPIVRFLDENLRPTASFQFRLEFERQLPQGWKISASHSWTRGWNELRSRNINAPVIDSANPDPRTAPRPLGIAKNILLFESTGKTFGRVLSLTLNQSSNKRFNATLTYLNFDFKTTTDDPFLFPQSSYDSAGEWARPSWQMSHRIFINGTVNLPLQVRAGVSFIAASGTPFNITTGRDNNGDGNFNDRPSLVDLSNAQAISTRYGFLTPNTINGNLPRNAGTNPANVTFNLNLSRTFTFGEKDKKVSGNRKLAANVRFNNLFNRTNPLNVSGVLISPFFGRANASAPARRIEFGLRYSF
jgi:hypothetical protein